VGCPEVTKPLCNIAPLLGGESTIGGCPRSPHENLDAPGPDSRTLEVAESCRSRSLGKSFAANSPMHSSKMGYERFSGSIPESADMAGLRNRPLRLRRVPNRDGIFLTTCPETATARTVLIRRGARSQMISVHALSSLFRGFTR